MKINEINNLLELFYYQYQKQSKKNIFLESLKEPKKKYSWEDVYSNVIKLSKEISKNIKKSLYFFFQRHLEIFPQIF